MLGELRGGFLFSSNIYSCITWEENNFYLNIQPDIPSPGLLETMSHKPPLSTCVCVCYPIERVQPGVTCSGIIYLNT